MPRGCHGSETDIAFWHTQYELDKAKGLYTSEPIIGRLFMHMSNVVTASAADQPDLWGEGDKKKLFHRFQESRDDLLAGFQGIRRDTIYDPDLLLEALLLYQVATIDASMKADTKFWSKTPARLALLQTLEETSTRVSCAMCKFNGDGWFAEKIDAMEALTACVSKCRSQMGSGFEWGQTFSAITKMGKPVTHFQVKSKRVPLYSVDLGSMRRFTELVMTCYQNLPARGDVTGAANPQSSTMQTAPNKQLPEAESEGTTVFQTKNNVHDNATFHGEDEA